MTDDEGQEVAAAVEDEEDAVDDEKKEEEMKVVVVRQIKMKGRQYFCIQSEVLDPPSRLITSKLLRPETAVDFFRGSWWGLCGWYSSHTTLPADL